MLTCSQCGQKVPWKACGFGTRLRMLRENDNLSQREAAEKCGIPQTTWASYEGRSAFPAQKAVEKLAAGMRVKVTDLLGFTDPLAVTMDDLPGRRLDLE